MKSTYLRIGDWILRHRPASGRPTGIAFLVHGWKGDENVMWIFADRLPDSLLLVAPRALYPTDSDGYSWVRGATGEFSTLPDFDPALQRIETLAEDLALRFDTEFTERHLVGFSQGAALCYAWAAAYPGAVGSIAGLAGFVPDGVDAQLSPGQLDGVRIFMGHGEHDRTVPLEMAEAGARILNNAGASVQLCVDDVGHKVGADCMRSLEAFYRTAA